MARVVYKGVAVEGEGEGAGGEDERFLPLDWDMTPQAGLNRDQCAHASCLEDIGETVYMERQE